MKTKKIVLIVLVLAIAVVAGLVYHFNKPVILAPELNIQPAPHESIKDIL